MEPAVLDADSSAVVAPPSAATPHASVGAIVEDPSSPADCSTHKHAAATGEHAVSSAVPTHKHGADDTADTRAGNSEPEPTPQVAQPSSAGIGARTGQRSSSPQHRPGHASIDSTIDAPSALPPLDALPAASSVSSTSSLPLSSTSPAPTVSASEDSETDEAADPEEASDDIHNAMTKSALCSCLFTLTRTGKLTLSQSNQLSRALCSSARTLRDFEALLERIKQVELEATQRQDAWLARQRAWTAAHPALKPKRSFFGLGKKKETPAAVFPEPSPLNESQRDNERMVWHWVTEQMAEIMPASAVGNSMPASAASSPRGGMRSMHSSSTPNMAQLLAASSASSASSSNSPHVRSPMISTLQPVMILSDSSRLHHRSHSLSGPAGLGPPGAQYGRASVSGSNSPNAGPANSQQQQHLLGALLPEKGGTSSPRRLFRALFYTNSAVNSTAPSAATSAASSAASSPRIMPQLAPGSSLSPSASASAAPKLVVQSHRISSAIVDLDDASAHFDSFPRLDELLRGIIQTPLPRAVIRGFEQRDSQEAHVHSSAPAALDPDALPPLSLDEDSLPPAQSVPLPPLDLPAVLAAPWLLLHPAFPFPVPSPLTRFTLTAEAQSIESATMSAFSDVLLNYRKHLPLSKLNAAAAARSRVLNGIASQSSAPRFTSTADVLLDWWLTSWTHQPEPVAATSSWANVNMSSRPQLPSVASPLSSPSSLATPLARDTPEAALSPMSPNMLLPPPASSGLNDPASPNEPVDPSTVCATPVQLRLLLLMFHWLFLCPHDFNADKAAMARLNSFLLAQQARFKVPPPPGFEPATGSPPSGPHQHPVCELLRQLQSMLLRCSSPSFQLDAQGRALTGTSSSMGSLVSPLQLLAYPFSDEVDAMYSSNLFSYPPVQLAHELLLHAFDLFRRVPLEEWMDGAWQNKALAGGAQPGNPANSAYVNAYSLAVASPEDAAAAAASAGGLTATSLFIADFNRLVFWMSTEILHPRLNATQRQNLVLYFLELAFVSLHAHRNFHVVFAVSATFANQAIYRLAEVKNLESMELRYANPVVNQMAERDAQQFETRTSNQGEDSATRLPGLRSKGGATSVKEQYSELKALTSSRNNYATYRSLVSSLLGETTPPNLTAAPQSLSNQRTHSGGGGGSNGAWMGTTPCPASVAPTPSTPSTPLLYPLSDHGSTSRGTSNSSDAAHHPPPPPPIALTTFPESHPNHSVRTYAIVDFPSAAATASAPADATAAATAPGSGLALQHADGVGGDSVAKQLNFSEAADHPASPSSATTAAAASAAAPLVPRSVTLVPHLAVHLKDLTYSQELSGVELQWIDEPPEQGDEQPQSHPSALSFRFDRARWRRTSRFIFQLLRFQSLPILSSPALDRHCPALYTLLQVHMLTHVLPESELLQLSFDILPRVDRLKVKKQQQEKKALSALEEEGFM